MNRMADVAALFGKKLGEEFWLQGFCGVYKVKLTESGLYYLDTDEPNKYRWRQSHIDPLITDNAEILPDDDWRVKQHLKDLARQVIVDE